MRSLCAIAAALSLAASGQARPGIKFVDGTDTFTGPARGYAPGTNVRIPLAVENTGFGKLLLPSRAEVILASQTATNTASVAFTRGNFSSLEGGKRKNIVMEFTVPKNLEPGTYDFLLRVSAPLKDEKPGGIPRRPVRLANGGMWNEALKANMLGQVLSVTR